MEEAPLLKQIRFLKLQVWVLWGCVVCLLGLWLYDLRPVRTQVLHQHTQTQLVLERIERLSSDPMVYWLLSWDLFQRGEIEAARLALMLSSGVSKEPGLWLWSFWFEAQRARLKVFERLQHEMPKGGIAILGLKWRQRVDGPQQQALSKEIHEHYRSMLCVIQDAPCGF